MRKTALILLFTITAKAQFQIQQSHTTASLRGIHAINDQIAWASGTNGTVLHTIDGGNTWQTCTIPPNAEKLDFRGIQAFDENTAIVMSSGLGDLSRLYKTTDACKSWKLVFINPDKEGFWDAIVVSNHNSEGLIIGDQVDDHFALFGALYSTDRDWNRIDSTVRLPKAKIPLPHSPTESLFAASNSVLKGDPGGEVSFVTGSGKGAYLYAIRWQKRFPKSFDRWDGKFVTVPILLAKGPTSGAFSFAARTGCPDNHNCVLVAVGGDFKNPDEASGTAAYGVVDDESEVPRTFSAAQTPPHGYRSSVAYDSKTKTWITVGPNGTDISRDDGRNWTPLKPTASDPPDADKNWNALSLPFVVGPNGRIGKLSPTALKP
jgi:Photosynthesis system II assembly factor YCF48